LDRFLVGRKSGRGAIRSAGTAIGATTPPDTDAQPGLSEQHRTREAADP
jgi:hypothetical protein